MRLIHALLALLALLAAGGCSRVSLVYNTADYFIEGYAEDYLETNNAQMSDWRPTLVNALSRHRREELPYLAAFFDAFHQAVHVGLEPPAVECLVDDFQEIYRRHFRLASDLAAPLLVIHGDWDETIPVHLGRELFDAATVEKRFVLVEGAGHNDVIETNPHLFYTEVARFVGVAFGEEGKKRWRMACYPRGR